MKSILLFLFIINISFNPSFSQEGSTQEEIRERDKILGLYGNQDQVEITEIREKINNLIGSVKNKHNLIKKRIKQAIATLPEVNTAEISDIHKKIREQQIEQVAGKYFNLLDKSSSLISKFRNTNDRSSIEAYQEIQSQIVDHIKNIEVVVHNEYKADMPTDSIDSDRVMRSITSGLENVEIEDNFFTGFMNEKMKNTAEKMMKSNPFSKMPKNELRQFFLIRFGSTAAGKYLNENPKILDILVEVCHDQKAIPKFISLINKPKQMQIYGVCVVVVFLLVFSVNFFNSKKDIFTKILIKFSLMWVAAGINFLAFYILFQEELEPTIAAIRRVI